MIFNPIYSPIKDLVKDDVFIIHEHKNRLCSNATYFEYDNKSYLIPRIENLNKSFNNKNNFWTDHKDNILLQFDNTNNKIIDQTNLSINNPLVNSPRLHERFEHFRTFYHNNKVYSNHSFITPRIRRSNNHIRLLSDIYDRVTVSIVDPLGSNLTIVNSISSLNSIFLSHFERNWVFYSNNEILYLVYSIDPYIVFYSKDDGQSFELLHKLWSNIKWNQNIVSNNRMKFRNSCNPIAYDENNLLMFYHTRDEDDLQYYYGVVLLDKNTLRITKYSNNPILYYSQPREKFRQHRWHNVYYLMSINMNKSNNTLELFGGKSHRAISKIVLDKDILDETINNTQYMTIL